MKMKTMQMMVLCGYALTQVTAAYAHESQNTQPTIVFQVSKDAWVDTKSGRVTVDINMVLDRKGLVHARKQLLSNLQIIASGEWQVSSFNRSKDQSGLERVNATATARIAEAALDGLQANATRVSQPGSNYMIRDVEFTPSLDEVEAAKQKLRISIMETVKTQLAEVRRVYANDNYVLQRLSFVAEMPWIARQESQHFGQAKMMAMDVAAPQPSAFTVSQKIEMTAMVNFAIPSK